MKETLQAEIGLPVDSSIPLIGFIGRLEEQKGSDILVEAIAKFADENVQIVVLVSVFIRIVVSFLMILLPKQSYVYNSYSFLLQGTGKKIMEKQIEVLEEKYPGKAIGITKFNSPLAHKIIAGADFIVIPSRFEPCGLVQLHAMPYGTVEFMRFFSPFKIWIFYVHAIT